MPGRGGRRTSERRGQLLLIAGLGIAMTLVVLAIVLNTVIFTQNLATREAVDTRSPVEFTNAVDEGIGGAIVETNFWNATNYNDLDAQFRRSVTTWAGNATRFSASKGMAADVQLQSTTNGTRVIQSTSRPLTNETGVASWRMATNVNQVRRFHMNLSQTSLEPSDGTGLPSSNVFRINVSNTTETWSLYVYENTSGTNVVEIAAIPPSGPQTTCSTTHGEPFVDVTEATLNGTACDFAFAENVSGPYNLTVGNGDNAAGRYTFVVEQENATFQSNVGESYNSSTPSTAPYTAPAIYSADVHVAVDRADITYTRNMTIAPEGTPVGERFNVSS